MKGEKRERERFNRKRKRIKHGEGKREQKQGLSKTWIKLIKESLRIK